ncbi:MAG: YIP1 family protein [Pseudorhodobacter sp.]|nr:YIP1 family protein [Pseudorhodobacter sp.]
MAVSSDILASYRHPRAVLRRKLDQGVREDRALAVLLAACVLNFVAQWPGLARAAHFDPTQPLEARIGGALLATVFLLPLIAYAVAAISHLLARVFGGSGSFYGARLALFWSMLAIAPLLLLHGLVRGFIGAGPAQVLMAVLVLVGFLYLWLNALIEAEY